MPRSILDDARMALEERRNGPNRIMPGAEQWHPVGRIAAWIALVDQETRAGCTCGDVDMPCPMCRFRDRLGLPPIKD